MWWRHLLIIQSVLDIHYNLEVNQSMCFAFLWVYQVNFIYIMCSFSSCKKKLFNSSHRPSVVIAMNTKSPDVLTRDSFMWYWGLNKHDLNIWHTYGDRIKMSYKCLLLCTSMGTGKFCIDEGIGMECSHFILKRRKMRSNQGQHCKIFLSFARHHKQMFFVWRYYSPKLESYQAETCM